MIAGCASLGASCAGGTGAIVKSGVEGFFMRRLDLGLMPLIVNWHAKLTQFGGL
ncbi:hypothetical protein TRICHSKD4_5962 [Roseibium sp. TrichSKD4]|nr:hypothetical protein TRICHSKD4_5962 [Roseibium sp. TrichSKD4]